MAIFSAKEMFKRGASILSCAIALLIWPNSARAISSAVNISTRLHVETGENVGIAGFIVTGTGQKQVLVRALGPTLSGFGVSGVLADPVLELHDATGAIITTNDNWKDTQQSQISATGLAPGFDAEAALVATLNPGAYTAIVRGANNSVGIALIEVYDLDPGSPTVRLTNISTRGDVGMNDNVMIGGFSVSGDIAKRLIVRVDGPSLFLNGQPIAGRLMDPALDLVNSNGTILASNDNWRTTQQTEIQASTLAPGDDHEPAVISTLSPANYTAIARGTGGATGIALIEVYDLDFPPQADGSVLYIAQLRSQSVGSFGSGTATLKLAADGKSAILNFEYSDLSSPVTGMHVHGPSGEILFDVDAATPQPDGSYVWVFQQVGNDSVDDIANFIRTGQTYFNIHTTNNPKGEIKGFFVLSSGGQTAPTPTPAPPLASGTPSVSDAGRFLAQSTFGATDELIAQVQQLGFEGFLNQQFSAAASSELAFVDASGVNPPTNTQTLDAFWTNAINANDQLRQRVAFALSEIFVVSINSAGLGEQPRGFANYMDMLSHDAFGNFRQLLEDVTLNPVMGQFLDMLKNDKGDPTKGTHPNENYAREIMQLFSIGLYRLNLDASLTLDARGFPIDTYNQDAVLGLAAAFTGWNFHQTGSTQWYGLPQDYINPMTAVPGHHDTNQKNILDGVTMPAGQTPQQDLKQALDTIFNDPNVGPFICKQLIQRLVTSNPSPGYIWRVTSIFNDNGQGVRGDMQAVIRAILMDYDARGDSKASQGYGHEREPPIRLLNLLRAYHATSPGTKIDLPGSSALGEQPFRAPTVFNFFAPDYEAPGAIAANGLTSPELEITTETTTIAIANFLRNAIYSGLGPSTDRVMLNLSNEINLASNPTALVDHLNSLFMCGQMSSNMRTTLINAVTNIPATNPTERAQTAIYLVINSPEFVIQK